MVMRKILTLLFLLIPLLGNAQQLYKANAMRFKEGDKPEQWEKCDLKVFIDEKLNIRIYRSKDILELKSVNDDYQLKEDAKSYRLSWICVDDDGYKCMPIMTSDKESFIYLSIHYPDMNGAIIYSLEPYKWE